MATVKKTHKGSRTILRSAFVLFLLHRTQEAHAAVYGGGGLKKGIEEAAGLGGITNITSLSDLILKVITFILDFVLLLAVVAIIIAGIYLITSNGDEGQKDKAKKIIFYAIIGILVVLFSRLIVVFVNNIFT